MLADISTPNPWLLTPFVLLLTAMAVLPVAVPAWWARHYGLVALGLGAVTVGCDLGLPQAPAAIGRMFQEYVSFIALVGGLFVVAGGIHIEVPGRAGPLANTGFLLAGAVLANVLGTTGAAMLLIRPWLRLNDGRARAYHLIFFIFIVANVGGCLTPVGDPPLLLGYLQGVPFWWVARHCWPMWAAGVGLLLAIFYGVDQWHQLRRPILPPPAKSGNSGRLEGKRNLFFLAVILGAVFVEHPAFLREGLMAAAAAGSYFTTKKSVRATNGFNFHPLREVAVLFAGIFATMIPVLDWLAGPAMTRLGHHATPAMLYWGSGLLSGVLDSAPAYLAAFSTLAGGADAAGLLSHQAAGLTAVSVGTVFFGAATYLGNGPNFMVKVMAEERNIPMPSLGGMVLKYTLPVLLPVLGIVWVCFFRS